MPASLRCRWVTVARPSGGLSALRVTETMRAPPQAAGPGCAECSDIAQTRPSLTTSSRSETSSATEASIRPRENSLMSRPWTIS